MAAPKGELQRDCSQCGRVATKTTRNAYIQRREGGFIVWYAVCNACKLKEVQSE